MLGECDLTANEIIRVGAKSSGRPPKSLDAAVAALKELMGDKGWTSKENVEKLYKEKTIPRTTVYRAKDELNIKTYRAYGQIWWVMPGTDFTQIQCAV